ncbi:heavy-metal-associated domain-containing protein [Pollutimonas subterranea]|nr:heavy-metal-associated domain-containing protein [Pollutimonas subterranea]
MMQIGMLKLAGLKNENCAGVLAQALKAVNGVSNASVSFGDSKATVTYDEEIVSTQRLQVAVQDAGYSIAKPVHGEDSACCGGCGG